MHQEAYDGFSRMLDRSGVDKNGTWKVLDVGGADVNGTVHGLLPSSVWTALDIEDAPNVEIVADAATWRSKRRFDIVTSTEGFEHMERWPEVVETMAKHLGKNGPQLFLSTCASTGRAPHGARGEWGVPEGQWYGNVPPDALREVLEKHFQEVHVEYNPRPGDVYAWAQGLL